MREAWNKKTLQDVCHIQQGKTLAISKLTSGEYPVYGANGIVGYFDEYNFDFPVTGLGCRGSCGTIHFIKDKAFLANNVMAIWEKNPKELTAEYLPLAIAQIDLISTGAISGQVQPQITKQSLGPVELSIPPLKEQLRIVDLISSVDSYIDALEAQAEIVTRSRSAALHEMINSDIDGRTETTLGEIASWGSGGTPKADNPDFYDGDIPWCVIGDLTESNVWKTEKKITNLGLENSSAKIIDPGSVLIAMYGASIGRTGISAIPMATNQAIASARCNTDIVIPKYLLVYLQTQKAKFVEMGQGAAQPNISQTIIKSWPISLPDISYQQELVSMIELFDSTRFRLQTTVESARLLRSALLSDLLSGDHEMPESYDKVMGTA